MTQKYWIPIYNSVWLKKTEKAWNKEVTEPESRQRHENWHPFMLPIKLDLNIFQNVSVLNVLNLFIGKLWYTLPPSLKGNFFLVENTHTHKHTFSDPTHHLSSHPMCQPSLIHVKTADNSWRTDNYYFISWEVFNHLCNTETSSVSMETSSCETKENPFFKVVIRGCETTLNVTLDLIIIHNCIYHLNSEGKKSENWWQVTSIKECSRDWQACHYSSVSMETVS